MVEERNSLKDEKRSPVYRKLVMLLCQVLVWWFRFDLEDRRFAPPGLLIPGSPLLPRWSKRLSCFSVAFTMHVSCDPCAGRIALIVLRWSDDTFPCPWRILNRQEQVPPLIRSSCQGKGFCHCLLCGCVGVLGRRPLCAASSMDVAAAPTPLPTPWRSSRLHSSGRYSFRPSNLPDMMENLHRARHRSFSLAKRCCRS